MDGANKAWTAYNNCVLGALDTAKPDPYTRHSPFARPITAILKCCARVERYDGLDDDIIFMTEEAINYVDGYERLTLRAYNISFFGTYAEACLLLAKRISSANDERKSALIVAGLKFSSLAESNLKDEEGGITQPIAFAFFAPVQAELNLLSMMEDYKHSDNVRGAVDKLNIEDSAEQSDKELPV